MDKTLLSVILVDDEPFATANLKKLIGSYCTSMQIVDSASSVSEATIKINNLKPDVIFLDVNMPKQNGFDLLNQLTHIPLVVFVTAHEQYALRAMKVCAVDFLLKPIDIQELIQTEAKLLQVNAIKEEIKKNYRMVLRNLSDLINKKEGMRKITLYGNQGYEVHEIDDILYLTGSDNYSTFHFLNHKGIMISKTLKDYEEILEPFEFMRIHKSTLINLLHVKKIFKNENLEIIMSNGEHLHVSRRKAADLMEWSKGRVETFL